MCDRHYTAEVIAEMQAIAADVLPAVKRKPSGRLVVEVRPGTWVDEQLIERVLAVATQVLPPARSLDRCCVIGKRNGRWRTRKGRKNAEK